MLDILAIDGPYQGETLRTSDQPRPIVVPDHPDDIYIPYLLRFGPSAGRQWTKWVYAYDRNSVQHYLLETENRILNTWRLRARAGEGYVFVKDRPYAGQQDVVIIPVHEFWHGRRVLCGTCNEKRREKAKR